MIALFILISIAGIAKAIVDTLQFHYSKSVFKGLYAQYWNPDISWVNKYADDKLLIRKKWFFIIPIPIPVLFSDAYHLFQSIFLTSLFISICLFEPITQNKIIDLILLRSLFGLFFIMFYNWILIKNNGKQRHK